MNLTLTKKIRKERHNGELKQNTGVLRALLNVAHLLLCVRPTDSMLTVL